MAVTIVTTQQQNIAHNTQSLKSVVLQLHHSLMGVLTNIKHTSLSRPIVNYCPQFFIRLGSWKFRLWRKDKVKSGVIPIKLFLSPSGKHYKHFTFVNDAFRVISE